jgi:hypothetical protein
MGRLYRLDGQGRADELTALRCRDEDAELQQLLAQNLHLLPGDQIRPEDPRRWLLVQREMPVEGPADGSPRWSVDLLLVDQDATPTFVECKRFRDTRARREVLGQMLDYAANAHFYWSGADLCQRAAATAAAAGGDLARVVRELCGDAYDSPETFFEAVQVNLREGRVRLVFFLDEAPIELKSIVDFLNRQMERSEVLVVEAPRYEAHGARLVAPALFGYTEEARRAKRSGAVARGEARRRWSQESFFEEAARRLDEATLDAVRCLHRWAVERGLEIHWGTGSARGSFNLVEPRLCRRSFVSLWTDGSLHVRGDWYRDTPEAEKFAEELEAGFAWILQVEAPVSHAWELEPACWVPAAERLRTELERLLPPGPPLEL